MWIHSIKLKNFKSYAQAELHFPSLERVRIWWLLAHKMDMVRPLY